ncbi:MAG TPA: efflux RND transporter permease subunit, partial [Burkholderiales bacterium]|nr:efflux RND transporter permease subunit [Burkholderiales bacterium]
NQKFQAMLKLYDVAVGHVLRHPTVTLVGFLGLFVGSLALLPFLGMAYFPRTDPGQFVINLKTPTGTNVDVTEQAVAKIESIVKQEVGAKDLRLIVSNIGSVPGFSSMYTPNSASHTAFVQVSLNEEHDVGSYEYMDKVRARITRELPQITVYFQSGGLVDAVLNLGLPTPIDVQVSGSNLEAAHDTAVKLADSIRRLPGVNDVLVAQDIDAPSLRMDIDRVQAAKLGLTQKEVVSNIITALTSNAMIAPSYWVDQRSGNDYLLTVQYPEQSVENIGDLKAIPIRASNRTDSVRLDAMAKLNVIRAPTEVGHYQLRRVVDVYIAPAKENIRELVSDVEHIVSQSVLPEGVRVALRGTVQSMRASFSSFGLGLLLSVVLVYLVLVAQFASFLDPLLILLAIPTGLTGVLVTLLLTGTTLNVMSLMGVVMMVGIVVSNSILIVEFTRHLRSDGVPLREAVALACRVRLRPVLMTSLATIIGLIPMAAKLGTGSEAYAPLARAIIGGLSISVITTVFIIPAAYLLAHRRREVPVGSPESA